MDDIPVQAAVTVRKRAWRRGLDWVLRISGAAVIVLLLTVISIRTYNLWGLSRVPEPFDVVAFENRRVPDAENAYPFYAKAGLMLDGNLPSNGPAKPRQLGKDWSNLGSDAQRWVERNLPALEIWRQGTDRPLLRFPRGAILSAEDFNIANQLELWQLLSLLQASRLEETGDLSGAWNWHKARLRMRVHYIRLQTVIPIHNLTVLLDRLIGRAELWGKLPGITVAQLRQAIADVQAMELLYGNRSDMLKLQYLYYRDQIEDLASPADPDAKHANESYDFWHDTALPLIHQGDLVLTAEPERSRRTLRHLFANWLAEADKPPDERAPVHSAKPLVFRSSEESDAAISADTLAWQAAHAPLIAQAHAANIGIDDWPQVLDSERRACANFIVQLASRIYEIEQGKLPNSPEHLVGTVLDKLPDFFTPIASPPSSEM